MHIVFEVLYDKFINYTFSVTETQNTLSSFFIEINPLFLATHSLTFSKPYPCILPGFSTIESGIGFDIS